MNLFHFRYSWRAFGGDLSGGLVAALIAIPYGLGFGQYDGPAAGARARHVHGDRTRHCPSSAVIQC